MCFSHFVFSQNGVSQELSETNNNLLTSGMAKYPKNRENTTFIGGKLDGYHPNWDTLKIYFWTDHIYGHVKGGALEFDMPLSPSGEFRLELPLKSGTCRISIREKRSRYILMSHQLVEPGDSVLGLFKFESQSNVKSSYIGIGQAKYNIRSKYLAKQRLSIPNPDSVLSRADSIIRSSLLVLDKTVDQLSPIAYSIIKADLIGEEYYYACKNLLNIWSSGDSTMKQLCLTAFSKILSKTPPASNNILVESVGYSDFLYEKNKFNLIINGGGQQMTFKDLFAYIINNNRSEIKEKLIMYALINGADHYTLFKGIDPTDFEYCLQQAEKIITKTKYQELLSVMTQSTVRGKKAYNFSLPNPQGKYVTLDNFKGKVVLLDIYGPGCSACITFKNNFTKVVYPQLLNKQDLVVIAVSTGEDRDRWLKEITLYSSWKNINLYTEGKGYNHPLADFYNINAVPRIIIIDKQGHLYSGTAPLQSDKILSVLNKVLALPI